MTDGIVWSFSIFLYGYVSSAWRASEGILDRFKKLRVSTCYYFAYYRAILPSACMCFIEVGGIVMKRYVKTLLSFRSLFETFYHTVGWWFLPIG